MRQWVLPVLEEGGVDLVLSGHSHSYERSFLLDGHYGPSSTLTEERVLDGGDGREDGDGAYAKATLGPAPHEGSVYIVAGSSGWTDWGPLNHPAMYISLLRLGSVVLDIDGNRLDARFLRDTGAIDDYFTILKDPVVSFIRGDSNGDGLFDIADPVATLAFLFSMKPVSCRLALDVNDDNNVDIADPIYALRHLFVEGPPPPPPFPECGDDPGPTPLSCEDYPLCP